MIVPFSLPGIFLLLALVVTAVPRLAVRMVSQYEHHPCDDDDQLPTLIMGAGSAVLLAQYHASAMLIAADGTIQATSDWPEAVHLAA